MLGENRCQFRGRFLKGICRDNIKSTRKVRIKFRNDIGIYGPNYISQQKNNS